MEAANQPAQHLDLSIESSEDYPPAILTDVLNTDTMGQYLRDVSKTPLLEGKEEEAELSQRIEAGLYAAHLLITKKGVRRQQREELEWIAADGAEAKNQFISANLRLVIAFAKKYRGIAGVPQTDIVQYGNLGLIHAVEKFDHSKGYKFSTYATWWIRQSINRELSKTSRMIYLPAVIGQEVEQIAKARRNLENQGIAATPVVLAKETKMEVDHVRELLLWQKEHISLETPLGHENDATLGDTVADIPAAKPYELNAEDTSRLEKLNAIMQEILSDKEYLTLGHRHGLIDGRVLTYKDLGKMLKISSERVRQIEREAFQKTQAKFNQSVPERGILT